MLKSEVLHGGVSPLHRVSVVRATACFGFVALSEAAIFRCAARPAVSVFFCLAVLSMIVAACARPRSFAFSALTLFIVLGFWAKWVALTVLRIPLLEPVGSFDRSVAQWDFALIAPAVAAFATTAVRMVEVVLRSGRRVPLNAPGTTWTPSWYPNHRKLVWSLLAAVLLLATIANYRIAFFQVGVNALVILPLHLNAIGAWVVHVGIGLFVSIAASWEWQYRRAIDSAIVPPTIEATVTSISTLSRAVFLMHHIPYGLVIADEPRRYLKGISWRRAVVWVVVTGAAFGVTIAGVSAARVVLYPQAIVPESMAKTTTPSVATAQKASPTPALPSAVPVPSAGQTPISRSYSSPPKLLPHAPAAHPPTAHRELHIPQNATEVSYRTRYVLLQLSNMVIGRWIGLEGTMALASSPDRSFAAFVSILNESPSLGVRSAYQQLSGSAYAESESFTFMTIPGFVAVLAWSGSMLFIGFGAAIIAAILIGTEAILRALRVQPFTVAYIGCVLANAACQMNFPYLAFTLLVEMWFVVAMIAAASRLMMPGAPAVISLGRSAVDDRS